MSPSDEWTVTSDNEQHLLKPALLFHTLFGMADDKAKKHIEDIYGKK